MTNPFPIVRTGDKFTVKFIENDIVSYVECKNEDEAVALSNVRPFCEAYLAHQLVDLQELQKSIDALERHALTHVTAHGLLFHLKEDIEADKIK